MDRIALIPARGGSKGIVRKNIKLFNSKPLIYWSILTASRSNNVDRIIVSTDDEEIASIAESFSAEVPFLRPKEFAKDDSPGIDPVLHALENISNVQDLILLQPTSPLRKEFHIDDIFKLRKKCNVESAVSISLSRKHIDLFFRVNSKLQIQPFSNNFKELPRQKYEDLYTLNGSIYLSSKESILKNQSLFSPRTVGYIMSEEYSIDIDNNFDWEIAEFLMKKLL